MKNLKIVYSALLISLVPFGGFFVFLANSNGDLPSGGIILGVSIFLLPISWYVPLFFAKKKMIQEDLEPKEKFLSYSQSKIFSVIFLESGYMVNGVFYFVTASPIHWIGMGIFFAGMLLLFPREKEFFSLYKTREFPP
ncbi:hypothetical protein [Leptospira alstonii]|nr:hypothetical protein [Leptospira alstonii]